MSRTVRLLVLTQLLVVLTGFAVIASSQLVAFRPPPSVAVTTPLPEVVRAAAVRPVAKPVVRRAVKPVAPAQAAPRKHIVRLRQRHATATQAVPQPRIRRAVLSVSPALSGTSAQQRMEQAVARIPGYVQGSTTWVLAAKDGYWGTADWYHNTIYISAAVPANRIYDVVAHEWSHLRSVQVYDGDVDAATAAMNDFYAATGIGGSERAADCMARRLGATWTHYTPCADSHWQTGAAQLLSGHRI